MTCISEKLKKYYYEEFALFISSLKESNIIDDTAKLEDFFVAQFAINDISNAIKKNESELKLIKLQLQSLKKKSSKKSKRDSTVFTFGKRFTKNKDIDNIAERINELEKYIINDENTIQNKKYEIQHIKNLLSEYNISKEIIFQEYADVLFFIYLKIENVGIEKEVGGLPRISYFQHYLFSKEDIKNFQEEEERIRELKARVENDAQTEKNWLGVKKDIQRLKEVLFETIHS